MLWMLFERARAQKEIVFRNVCLQKKKPSIFSGLANGEHRIPNSAQKDATAHGLLML